MIENEEMNYAPMLSFLGDCYYMGRGVSEHNHEAFRLYSLAADQEDPSGLYGKGMCTKYGYGTPKSITAGDEMIAEAVEKMIETVEEQIDPYIQARMYFNIGHSYFGANGVERDLDIALNYLEKAAELGSSRAAEYAGNLYYNIYSDLPSPVHDKTKALSYYEQAALGGERNPMFMAGYMYYIGSGTDVDYEKAVFYLQMAKDAGDSNAVRYLGDAQKALAEQQAKAEETNATG